MAQRKQLFSISYHYDSDTGMYQVGELDYGIDINLLSNYVSTYGTEGLASFLRDIADKIEGGHFPWGDKPIKNTEVGSVQVHEGGISATP